jgi:hypothetical protein
MMMGAIIGFKVKKYYQEKKNGVKNDQKTFTKKNLPFLFDAV